LQNPFDVETEGSGYAMGEMMMHGRNHVFYHYEVFYGEVLNYPTYDKDIYPLLKDVKNWNHYQMEKYTIIHIDHQPLQYLQY
jgi:hypothetical protein